MTDYNLKCIYEQMQRQSIDLSKYKGPSKEQKQQNKITTFRQQMANYKTGNIIIDFLPDGKTDLTWVNLPEVVYGNFWCISLGLTSLKGAPTEIKGSFICYNNNLPNLQGGPVEVGKNFNCTVNELTSLKGAPVKIDGSFDCSDNKLTSLEGAPKVIGNEFISDVFSHEDYINFINKPINTESK